MTEEPRRVNSQVVLEFRMGPGEVTGKRGELLFAHTIDARQAHNWRGLVGQGLPSWTGGMYIYADDALISVLPPREGGAVMDRAPTPEEMAYARSELARLQSHQVSLQQQLEVDGLRLQATQEELVRLQQMLVETRTRYSREVAELDESLSRARREATEQRTQIFDDLNKVRNEAAAARTDVLEGVRATQGLLTHFRDHVGALAGAEMEQARLVQRRKYEAEAQLTADLNRLKQMANTSENTEGFAAGVKAFFEQLAGFLPPEVIISLLNRGPTPSAQPPA